MAEPTWTRFDPSFGLLDELNAVKDLVGPIAGLFEDILNALAAAAEVAGAFVQGVLDIQQAAITALLAAIDSLIQALTQTGIYRLFYMPQSYWGTLTMEQWVEGVNTSLDDYADELRPILTDDSAFVGAFAVVAVASSYKELLTDFRHAFDNFSKKVADAIQVDRWPNREDPWQITPGIGVEPNWGSIRLYDIIPPISGLVGYLFQLRSLVSSGLTGSDLYNSFSDLLKQKVVQLQGIIDYLNEVLTSLENALNFEGCYVLPIYGQGDKEWFKKILRNSRGGPWDVDGVRFTAGAVFLATGGTSEQADMLFSLFGLATDIADVPGDWS